MKIIIATKNRGKIKEIMFFFREHEGIQWGSIANLKSFPDIEETGDTFYENAMIKATTVSKLKKCHCLADDSGLEVDYLDGKPGVISSRYSGKDATERSNRKKLLDELDGVALKDRSARFICTMVLSDPGGKILHTSTGTCEGRIGYKETGDMGFGYDSIFIPRDHKKTMAQLTQAEKNAISHRGRALVDMKKYLVGL